MRLATPSFLVGAALLCATTAVAQHSTADLVERLSRSVVFIITYDSDGQPLARGSGVIASSDGKIVTNFHVVEGSHLLKVKFSNGTTTTVASLTDLDVENDIAVFAAPRRGLPWVEPKFLDDVRSGDEVVVIANPLGLEQSVSTGVVSAIRHLDENQQIIQITAPVSKGSSGGPVFSRDGKLIGIVVSFLTGGQNLNFVIPADLVAPLITSRGQVNLADLPARPKKEEPSKAASIPAFSMEGVWSGTFADSLSNGQLTFTLSQNKLGELAGTYTSSQGGGGTMSGRIVDDHFEMELSQNVQGCPGIFTGKSTSLSETMTGTYAGNDCAGYHSNGFFTLSRATAAVEPASQQAQIQWDFESGRQIEIRGLRRLYFWCGSSEQECDEMLSELLQKRFPVTLDLSLADGLLFWGADQNTSQSKGMGAIARPGGGDVMVVLWSFQETKETSLERRPSKKFVKAANRVWEQYH